MKAVGSDIVDETWRVIWTLPTHYQAEFTAKILNGELVAEWSGETVIFVPKAQPVLEGDAPNLEGSVSASHGSALA